MGDLLGPHHPDDMGRCLMMADGLPFCLLCTSAGNPPPQPRLPPCSTLCSPLCAHPPVGGLSQVRVLSHLPPPLHQKFQEVLDCLLEPRGQPQRLALNPGRRRPSPVCCMNSCLGWLLKGREEMNTVLIAFNPYKEEQYFCWYSPCARHSSKLFR